MHSLTMAQSTKPNTYRVYLNEDDTERMKKICDVVELGQSELLSKTVSAALRAIEANHNRFTLPLRFKLVDGLDPTDRPRK